MCKENILLSVNCITFNHGKYIRETLESILNQKTNFKFEVLIHDDASKDDTQAIIKEFQARYPEVIKPILREENQYSKGIKRIGYLNNHTRAKGKYIAWCEGDDYWVDETKLQQQVDYLESHDDCTLVFHNADMINTVTGKSEGIMIPEHIESRECTVGDLLELRFIPTASVVYRKWTLDNPPDWYMDAVVGDLPNNLISTSFGYAYYINKVMSVYRVGNMNSAMNKWEIEQKNIEAKINHTRKYKTMLEEFNKYSDYRFDEDVKKVILEYDFNEELFRGNIKKMKEEKYSDFYKALTTKNKAAIYMMKYIPQVFIKLKMIKYKAKLLYQNIKDK